jgi:DNA-binding Xre family transcriptional regulator
LERLPTYLPTKRETGEGEGRRERPGELLDRLRQEKRWTIEQLALEAGVDPKQIYAIKRGEGVHTETVRKVAKALSCRPGDLLPE